MNFKYMMMAMAAAVLVLAVPLMMQVEAKEFQTDAYSVDIPKGCKTEDEQNRFSTDAYFDCKSKNYAFQFEMAGSPYTGTDEELPDQLLQVIKDKWGYSVEEVERGTDKYTFNNKTAPYVQATFQQEFTTLFGLPGDSEDWVYMVVGIKTGDDMLYAQFKNDESHFDKNLKVFEKVLNSIELKEGANNNNNTKKVTCFDDQKVEALGKLIGKPIDCVPKSELTK